MPFKFIVRAEPKDPTTITRRKKQHLDREYQLTVKQLGNKLLRLVKDEAPKRTGKFARAHTLKGRFTKPPYRIEIHLLRPLSKWIIKGTRAHWIEPKRKKALAFYWPAAGRYVVTSYVFHPGTDPNPYVDRAYKRWKPEARLGLKRVVKSYSDK